MLKDFKWTSISDVFEWLGLSSSNEDGLTSTRFEGHQSLVERSEWLDK